MVSLSTVHAHNASLKSLGPGLVAVFVGGTSGISLSTALALARHTVSPKIYLIGRSAPAAQSAINTIKTLNPSATTTFLQSDISLLRNVDSVCEKITKNEKHVNILFMTPGHMTLRGRDESAEGLDKKLVLHYYARMRFVQNLQALLTSASASAAATNSSAGGEERPKPNLSRVISVLDPAVAVRGSLFGLGSAILDYDDLSLKRGFSVAKCGHHASLMNNFFLEAMAQVHTGTSFIHAYPSGVDTGILRNIPGGKVSRGLVRVVLRPFMVPLDESGERFLFAATNTRYPAAAASGGSDGEVAVGSDGRAGSGCYWVSWDGEVFPQYGSIGRKREEGAVDRVVGHTQEVFRRVCEEDLTYP
ncbi:uncharacterized protein DSM5745_10483 [Aspergillus mulundensis]|uniref:Short-chain dehydrogenase n=1 Tax=Aspergillus mulundensis TaxID=1810919 RepID=A0A3D8QJC2_9EURO|nr:Uncharacterized protein DSM5745_10483 [Aspergillus mulundensis]RDW61811.1 Uncharacterized protein DSM5745_10483 [Aspergillus mulundensis]